MKKNLLEAIWEHAAVDYPREACGLIVQKGRVQRYFRCQNTAAEPDEHFVMDPEDYATAEGWGTVIAVVHSHPDATSQPSELDKAQCDLMMVPWHIISWPEGDLRTIYPRGELPLLERPFVLGYYDCWGLVCSYYRQTYGIELKNLHVDYPWWEDQYPDNYYRDQFEEFGFREFSGAPQPGDVVLMQVQSKKWNHAGVLLENNMLLHHMYGHLSKRVPYGGYYRDRTMKIVRHHSLCEQGDLCQKS